MSDLSLHDAWGEVFFAPVLPWHTDAFVRFMHQYHNLRAPHALLAAGNKGIGKHRLVGQISAAILCQNRDGTQHTACGHCSSCTWLKAHNHPDIQILSPYAHGCDDTHKFSIKIDDIRRLQDFVRTTSKGARVVILDFADKMNAHAANALLKSLEEPAHGVYWFLITDHKSHLLPTIKSRTQALMPAMIDARISVDFVKKYLQIDEKMAHMLLRLCDFAPLAAIDLPNQDYYAYRKIWLQSFMLLQSGRRTPMQAYIYWQDKLDLVQFCTLSALMTSELMRFITGVALVHEDIDSQAILKQFAIHIDDVLHIWYTILDVRQSLQQNIQKNIAYQKLIGAIAGA